VGIASMRFVSQKMDALDEIAVPATGRLRADGSNSCLNRTAIKRVSLGEQCNSYARVI